MAFADHLRLQCLIDGNLQKKVTNIQVNGQSGAQAVEAIEGLLGKTPGPKRVEIQLSWAVGLKGLEFDVVSAAANGTYHELQIPLGDKSVVAQCWVDSDSVSQGAGASTECSGTFIGEKLELQ